MNKKQELMLKSAHKLFVEKGFQATSIQDIVEDSGISKGTFYNYFSSKNELVIKIFESVYNELETKRNEFLIGQNRSDLDIFIKQIELQVQMHHQNQLFTLFEEIFFSNNAELKEHFKQAQLYELHWLYNRLIDLFGSDKKAYLLDCAIMFLGLLHRNFHYSVMAHHNQINAPKIIRYTVNRLVHLVKDVSTNQEMLFDPDLLTQWVPFHNHSPQTTEQKIRASILLVTKEAEDANDVDKPKILELLTFLQEELIRQPKLRSFVISSTLYSLSKTVVGTSDEFKRLEELIDLLIEEQKEPPM
ncbi:TetR/AcrR family transcriptional regulator [Priestia flexa]|uniref:TetR/AcrR family transcriptional regulator n=1 Tax=Priestia TaxID=2800373 RepID=UPI0022019047|nr:TetR/AcrR family transcriptional regulator [Priestia flexa]MDT2046066.1 TetR/AcrR family transcriptional regulator [Priestia flexa]USY53901.1 TetR/AcrR family transcriptional regulator [Bacillus sp. 1780r2a1]